LNNIPYDIAKDIIVRLWHALAGNRIDFGPPKQFDVFKALFEAVNKIHPLKKRFSINNNNENCHYQRERGNRENNGEHRIIPHPHKIYEI
jgi:hypothetical protein